MLKTSRWGGSGKQQGLCQYAEDTLRKWTVGLSDRDETGAGGPH